MYWQGAAALLLGASAQIAQAAAQVITITQNPSTCSAVYTAGSRSVTVVQSTVTVSPIPWNDGIANSGVSFVLQALPESTVITNGQFPAPRWVLPNGQLTTDGSQAARYTIKNGQLTTADGSISTFEGIPYGTFGVSASTGNINTVFRIMDGKLVWSNGNFTDGAAKFCQTPDGAQDPAHIVAQFDGTVNGVCVPYTLYARPINVATQATSMPPGMSSSMMSMSSVGVGMSSMQPPMSVSSYQTPGYTSQATNGGQASQTLASSAGGVSPSQSQGDQSASPSPTPTRPIALDGTCGGETGFYCADGFCCGQYGYCGQEVAYCGPGCQPEFGACWTTSSDTAVIGSPVTSAVETPASSGALGSTSPTDSGATPTAVDEPVQTYATCPEDDGQTVTTDTGDQYTIACGSDTTIGSYSSRTVPGGFNECFQLCDADDACMAFTYQGGVDGEGVGICYLKNQMVSFVPTNGDRLVGAMKVMDATASSSGGVSSTVSSNTYSTYTAPSTPIGPDNSGGPQSRPSSSSSTETQMASSMVMSSPDAMTSMSVSVSGASIVITTSSATPSSTMPVSPNGHCGTQGNGGTPEGFSCTGSLFGPCCSFSGLCGYSSDYCVAGCQDEYGECTAQDGHPITASGMCGMNFEGQTCTGGIFGPCCSASGFCGSTSDYCAPENCDEEFGTCDGDRSTSTVMMMSSISMSMSMASSSSVVQRSTSAPSSTQLLASSTISLPTSTSTLCPGANGTTYTDPSGTQYTILCGMGFDTQTCDQPRAALSLLLCADLCLTDAACVGVTFELNGRCCLKDSYDGASMNNGMDSAVIVGEISAYPSGSSSMMMSSTSTMASSTTMASSSTARAMSSSPSSSSSRVSTTPSAAAYSTPSSTPSSSRATSTASSSPSPSPSSSPARTTTTTTTSTTTTSTTSSAASPYLILPSPTPCDFGDPQGVDEDDSYCKITLPFAMRMYGGSDANTYASTNGYLSLTYGSAQYASQQLPASNIPNNTVAPFFDDLYLAASGSPRQGIFYQVQGTTVTYEWYIGRGGIAGRIYHWTVKYDSAVPGIFTYTYYATGGTDDQGLYAAVGAQGRTAAGAAVGVTYAYHVQTVAPGLVVVCDTTANTCVTAS